MPPMRTRSSPFSQSSRTKKRRWRARRQAMMQGEKVVADIRDAHDHLNSEAGILPLLHSVSRQLERRLPQAPELIEAQREGAR